MVGSPASGLTSTKKFCRGATSGALGTVAGATLGGFTIFATTGAGGGGGAGFLTGRGGSGGGRGTAGRFLTHASRGLGGTVSVCAAAAGRMVSLLVSRVTYIHAPTAATTPSP